jgi:hypothetical protein
MFAIIINTQFSAIHCWPSCPIPSVSFLKTPHRHVFHVTMKKEVFHDDRDVEFINFKDQVDVWIKDVWDKQDIGSLSCEMMAKYLADRFDCFYVRVMEDNENGSEYHA